MTFLVKPLDNEFIATITADSCDGFKVCVPDW